MMVFSACRVAVERRQHLADFLVDIGDVGEIGAARAADVVRGNRKIPPVAGVQNAPRMRVLRLVGDRRPAGVEMRAILVEVPIFPPRHVRVVRMGEADGQHPGARIEAAAGIIDLARRVIGDLVVIFELIGDLGDARAR